MELGEFGGGTPTLQPPHDTPQPKEWVCVLRVPPILWILREANITPIFPGSKIRPPETDFTAHERGPHPGEEG